MPAFTFFADGCIHALGKRNVEMRGESERLLHVRARDRRVLAQGGEGQKSQNQEDAHASSQTPDRWPSPLLWQASISLRRPLSSTHCPAPRTLDPAARSISL